MKIPSKIEFLHAIPLIIILLLTIIIPDYIPVKLYYFVCIVFFIRFTFPFIIIYHKFYYVDFSKILNILIWSFILGLIYYIDKSSKIILFDEQKTTLSFIIIFCFFQIMRGIHYYFNKEEPIIKYYVDKIGDFNKSRNRKITKADSGYTTIYIILFMIIIVIIVNL
jgi:hypothetical protein